MAIYRYKCIIHCFGEGDEFRTLRDYGVKVEASDEDEAEYFLDDIAFQLIEYEHLLSGDWPVSNIEIVSAELIEEDQDA